ncbi:retrovirus-related pol polyprotein from [Plakobranchus ocellatus]|uniref:Retrovirus-related pol polyprotein from n=1 Tax=Plakobranchus ocellatus TaxID=259542 RepID=A0AAV3ZWF2_9GAST|nr:retrovirus-related pol polyprotein from [Plakobranchus ocellatus]
MKRMHVFTRQEEYTDWASPIVAVVKPDKTLRLCMDPKELNKAIKRNKFSVPDPKKIRAKLGHAKYFTKFDAASGFWQIPLVEESSRLCSINTIWKVFFKMSIWNKLSPRNFSTGT